MKRAFLTCALIAAFAATATAQPSTGEQQVRAYLQSQAQKHSEAGFAADRANPDFVRALTLDQAALWPVRLEAGGRYRVFAVCDNGCSDVDLELYDPAGALVGRDVQTNDKPYVEVAAPRAGEYVARIWLAVCDPTPCTIGARVYQAR